MCSGGGGGTQVVYRYVTPKADPAPTAVTSAEVGADASAKREANDLVRNKKGSGSTQVAVDRNTLLGQSSGNDAQMRQKRGTLG